VLLLLKNGVPIQHIFLIICTSYTFIVSKHIELGEMAAVHSKLLEKVVEIHLLIECVDLINHCVY
jgi:hypothetical protein